MLGRVVHGIGQLVVGHLALARLEIGADLRNFSVRLVAIVAFVPMAVVGYGLLCGALAVLVGRWMTLAGALLVVGAVDLGAGGIGLAVARLSLGAKVDEREGEGSRPGR